MNINIRTCAYGKCHAGNHCEKKSSLIETFEENEGYSISTPTSDLDLSDIMSDTLDGISDPTLDPTSDPTPDSKPDPILDPILDPTPTSSSPIKSTRKTCKKLSSMKSSSISVLKSQTKRHAATKTSQKLQTDTRRSYILQKLPKTMNRRSFNYLESDGDSPRSESPQSCSGDDRMSLLQDQVNSLQYISNGAATAGTSDSENSPINENNEQVRHSWYNRMIKDPVLTDSDIRRNTLNDHSYTLNESNSQHLMVDCTSESGKHKSFVVEIVV